MIANRTVDGLRLGFACSWWHPREPTWSYTPAGLLRALSDQDGLTVTSIDAQRPLAGKAAMALAYRHSGTAWQHGRLNRWFTQRKILRDTLSSGSDVVLAMSVTEPVLPVPTFLYQDMGYSVVQVYDRRLGHRSSNLGPVTDDRIDVLVEEESDRYRACTGVFTMSQWFANWLTDVVGVPQNKIHVVGGGLNARPVRRRNPPTNPSTSRHRNRLLFVGRDFWRKGGDVVVEAVAALRQSGAGDYRLTVAGPTTWPLEGAPPEWVDFKGSLTPGDVSELWQEHDVFVLPSRFEAYGLTFLEARASGLPCVGRRAFAMPELVPDGAGALVAEESDGDELAAAIHAVSTDEAMAQRVARDAPIVAQENSWPAVAGRMLAVIRSRVPAARRTTLVKSTATPLDRKRAG